MSNVQPGPDETVIVSTNAGQVAGRRHDEVLRFAGIPFAAAPVGERRFAPPVPAEPWDGVRDASTTGAVSPQNPSLMDALFGGETERWDEDCLHLNVWTPEVGDAALPVMVWIHGGGFEMGSGSSPLYDGAQFARSGVVIVTLNYRLGSLGFLELGHLDPALAGSGSVGLLDQIAALEWVRDNIAAFGGDPERVTIFGESAGAMSVSLLMTMPRARGLFHRSIAQSGSVHIAMDTAAGADTAAEFLAAAGISTTGPEAVAELRALPVERLLAAHAAMSSARMADPQGTVRRTGDPKSFLPFRPVAEGTWLPEDPVAELERGAAADIPHIIGTNLEEWNLFSFLSAPADSEEALLERIAMVVPDPAPALAAYRSAHPDGDFKTIEGAFLTDRVFRIPAVRQADAQAKHAPTWQYLWSWRSPAFGGMIGAAHAIEIPFVFDLVEDHRLHVFVGPDAPGELAHTIHGAWIAFAKAGRPEVAGRDWPTADGDGRPVLVFDTESSVEHDPQSDTRRFWDGLPV